MRPEIIIGIIVGVILAVLLVGLFAGLFLTEKEISNKNKNLQGLIIKHNGIKAIYLEGKSYDLVEAVGAFGNTKLIYSPLELHEKISVGGFAYLSKDIMGESIYNEIDSLTVNFKSQTTLDIICKCSNFKGIKSKYEINRREVTYLAIEFKDGTKEIINH